MLLKILLTVMVFGVFLAMFLGLLIYLIRKTNEGYIFRLEKSERLKKLRKKDFDYYDFKKNVVENAKKHSAK